MFNFVMILVILLYIINNYKKNLEYILDLLILQKLFLFSRKTLSRIDEMLRSLRMIPQKIDN